MGQMLVHIRAVRRNIYKQEKEVKKAHKTKIEMYYMKHVASKVNL